MVQTGMRAGTVTKPKKNEKRRWLLFLNPGIDTSMEQRVEQVLERKSVENKKLQIDFQFDFPMPIVFEPSFGNDGTHMPKKYSLVHLESL